MSGLSRREFLAVSGAVAVAWGLPVEYAARALSATPDPAEVTTTLVETVRLQSQPSKGRYHRLLTGSGEPFTVRADLFQGTPNPGRTPSRRSLLYMGQFSDIHVIDTQSPARLEPSQQVMRTPSTACAARPNETVGVHVLDQMVAAMNDATSSPVTGSPMALAVVTGDSADSHNSLELRWYIDTLDGGVVTPNSGDPHRYEGIQAWGECSYAYHPDNPSHDVYGAYGFPSYPTMLSSAIKPLQTLGLKVPWLAIYGNHDTVFIGLLQLSWLQQQVAAGARKASLVGAFFSGMYGAGTTNAVLDREVMSLVMESARGLPGLRTVTRDTRRRLFERVEFMQAHLDSPPVPGPVGHGFTPENVASNTTWWARDVAPGVRLLGLDTCNVTQGADGCIYEPEWKWIEAELKANSATYYDEQGNLQTQKVTDKLIVLCSHHTSWTLENMLQPAFHNAKLYSGDDLVALLARFPNVVAWVNGHTHYNRIVAHPSGRGDGFGFWEINTPSCIDWGQQQRLVEFVDNRDGTLSIFTITLDHKGLVSPSRNGTSPQDLAGMGRELSANHWFNAPQVRLGSVIDRNCELLLRAPFDLNGITDTALQAFQLANRARLLAPHGNGAQGGNQ